MSTLVKVYMAMAAVPYWIGVYSGWYANHCGPMSEANPDTWIHAAVGWGSICLMVDLIHTYRQRRGGEHEHNE